MAGAAQYCGRMAKPTKRKVSGTDTAGSSRVTPKGTRPEGAAYEPPSARKIQPSPVWVPVLMFGLLALGIIVIVLNYVEVLLPGAPTNTWLLIGLGAILGGIITATQYR